jgi:hypothetical protein
MDCCRTEGTPVVPARLASSPLQPQPQGILTRWARRIATLAEWAVPIFTLALIPKCPACVAGYVLLFTGIGLSFQAATAMRWTLIAFSIAALTYLLLRVARRAMMQTAPAS